MPSCTSLSKTGDLSKDMKNLVALSFNESSSWLSLYTDVCNFTYATSLSVQLLVRRRSSVRMESEISSYLADSPQCAVNDGSFLMKHDTVSATSCHPLMKVAICSALHPVLPLIDKKKLWYSSNASLEDWKSYCFLLLHEATISMVHKKSKWKNKLVWVFFLSLASLSFIWFPKPVSEELQMQPTKPFKCTIFLLFIGI